MTPAHDVAVFIDPISVRFGQDRLLYPHGFPGSYYEPYGLVRELFAAQGIPVHTADFLRRGEDVRGTNLYFAISNLSGYPKLADRGDVILSALFHTEAPIVQPSVYEGTPLALRHFNRAFSFSTPAALAGFGCGDTVLERSLIPEPRNEVYEELWRRGDRDFLTIVTQNRVPARTEQELYSERLRAIEHFSRTDEIDLYGVGWDDLPARVGERRVKVPGTLVRMERAVRRRLPFGRKHPYHDVIRRVYRGAVESKYEVLSRYTFSLTYENMVLHGWINEKLFDAMLVGTIPIYLGAPDITDWVPEECFVDPRRFAGYAELRDYLHSLGPAEKQGYREAARAFLASDLFEPFSKETFARKFVESAEADLGISLLDRTATA
jgi:hypothetical protein